MTMNRKQKMAEFDQGYSITVTGRHLHVTEAMKTYAQEKLSRLERFGNRIIDVSVTMDIQRFQHKVDIVLKYGHTMIKSHASSSDMYISIDQAVEKLETQLNRYRSRLQEHYLKGHPIVEVAETVYYKGLEEIDEQEVNKSIEVEAKRTIEGEFPHQVVSVETQSLRILTDAEAIMKMELSQLPLIVFRDEQSRKLKVIYQRDDGNFGIIQLE